MEALPRGRIDSGSRQPSMPVSRPGAAIMGARSTIGEPSAEWRMPLTDYSHRYRSLETNLVHAGAPRPNIEGAVVTPLFQSANYLMADESAYDAVRYIRLSNSPNHHTLQARLAVAEDGLPAAARPGETRWRSGWRAACLCTARDSLLPFGIPQRPR